MGKLTARFVATETKPGRYADGDNLHLVIAPGGSKSWVFRWRAGAKRRDMGLGPLRAVSLAEARALSRDAYKQVKAGIDPIAARRKPEAATFGQVADEYLAAHGSSFANQRHRQQWKKALSDYAAPIRDVPIAEVDTAHVLSVVEPIWRTKGETASRLRGRLEKVLDYARAKGLRSGPNPALWRGHLAAILPKRQRLTRGHHPAMPVDEVPGFMAALCLRHATAALALRFAILTAARSGEVLGARWAEIDLTHALWTVPAGRMKMRKTHRVPLSGSALAVLESCRGPDSVSDDMVFPGQRAGRPLSDMALEMLLRRMGVTNAVPHGFRSSFRDWAGDHTDFPRELAEAALAHVVGDAAEQAYRRSDALEKRRGLMEAWAAFCDGGTTAGSPGSL